MQASAAKHNKGKAKPFHCIHPGWLMTHATYAMRTRIVCCQPDYSEVSNPEKNGSSLDTKRSPMRLPWSPS